MPGPLLHAHRASPTLPLLPQRLVPPPWALLWFLLAVQAVKGMYALHAAYLTVPAFAPQARSLLLTRLWLLTRRQCGRGTRHARLISGRTTSNRYARARVDGLANTASAPTAMRLHAAANRFARGLGRQEPHAHERCGLVGRRRLPVLCSLAVVLPVRWCFVLCIQRFAFTASAQPILHLEFNQDDGTASLSRGTKLDVHVTENTLKLILVLAGVHRGTTCKT